MRKWLMFLMLAGLVVPMVHGGEDATRDDYLERARTLDASDVTGHYLLGLWCRKANLDREARLEFGKVIVLNPDHAGARREMGYEKHDGKWLSRDQVMLAKGLVFHNGAWMLPEEVERLLLPEREKERVRQEEATARKLLVTMARGDERAEKYAIAALEGVDDSSKVGPLAYALRLKEAKVRQFAAKELGRIGDRRALRPLVYRSIMDPSAEVREDALASVKSFGDPNLLSPYVKAMYSESQPVRINAARAVGDLGEPIGIEYLIFRMSAHGGGHTRSHIYLARQVSFIQDYDVEVAQTSFIADPIVGILQEGQVLDVKVVSTSRTADILERRAVRASLRKLSGADLGDSPAAWMKWWKDNKKDLLAKSN